MQQQEGARPLISRVGEQQATYETADFELELPPEAADRAPIVREILFPAAEPSGAEDEGQEAFVLYNVLSPSECDDFIRQAERAGLKDLYLDGGAGAGDRRDYRNNLRVVGMSEAVARMIWERIRPFLGGDIEIKAPPAPSPQRGLAIRGGGLAYRMQGTWRPLGLNECWRLCKYDPGGHFAPHYDGTFVRNVHERSLKTFMLYLNDDFEGGSTNFVDENQKLFKDETGVYRAEEQNILKRLQPVRGSALVFNHMIMHEGERLKTGVKYIMRSDVMYERINSDELFDPKENQALQLLAQAERFEDIPGKKMEAVGCYAKAFKLWPPLEELMMSGAE